MIGERIKKLRKKKGYSLTELSKQAGVSKSYLSYIERDLQNNPSLKFLTKIAEQLDTSIEYLLEESKKMNHQEKVQPRIDTLDEEWKVLITKAIKDGMSKQDFRDFRDYIKFKNWKQNEENSNEHHAE